MRTLDQLLEKLGEGDRVLLRGDLNVPIRDGVVQDTTRIEALLPTITALRASGARLVLCSHLGRPAGPDPSHSLQPVAESLSGMIATDVPLLEAMPPDQRTMDSISSLAPGAVALLENLRFDPGEKKNDRQLAAILASLCDHYVNDAFGSCHRAHASVDAIARLRPAYAGLLVASELSALGSLKNSPGRPFWLVLGGAKIADKIGVIDSLSGDVDGMVVGGGMANTILAARGFPVGNSRIDPASIEDGTAQRLGSDSPLVLPVDFVCGPSLHDPDSAAVIEVGDRIPDGWAFYDIGPRSVELFEKTLTPAQTIFWNGPPGVFEEKAYQEGTRALAGFLAGHSGRVFVGGGDSAAAVRTFADSDSFHHVSTGGGAALAFLEGRSLPGIEALERSSMPS